MRTDKSNNFEFTIKFLLTLDRSCIGYLGCLGIDLFKSVLMYSNGDICLIKLLFKMGLFTVWAAVVGTDDLKSITFNDLQLSENIGSMNLAVFAGAKISALSNHIQ